MADFNLVAGIDWGTQLSSTKVTYAFIPGGTTAGGYSTTGWNTYEKGRVATVMSFFEAATNLTFEQVSDPAQATFRLALLDDPRFTSEGQFGPPGYTDAGLGLFNVNGNWSREAGGMLEFGGDGFQTLIHEMGHGLGLGHPHDNSGGTKPLFPGVANPFTDVGFYELNQDVYTMMSYITGWRTAPWGPNHDLNFGGGGLMAIDIAALQQKYGANTSYRTGNDIYDLPTANEVGTGWQGLWDAGGIDTIRYQGAEDAVINLNAATLAFAPGGGGQISYAEGIYGGFTIAHGVVIENAIGGSGNDTIIGNGANNVITPGAGDDMVWDTGMHDVDTVIIPTLSTDAAIVFPVEGQPVRVQVTSEFGTDTMTDIERVMFQDRTLALDVDGSTGEVFKLYMVAFDREGDQSGMTYWVAAMDEGAALNEVAASFAISDEFTELYDGMTSAEILTELYDNAFGREPDEAGFDYWLSELEAGTSLSVVMNSFAISGEMSSLVNETGVLARGVWLDTLLA